jgi:hypothetical protein
MIHIGDRVRTKLGGDTGRVIRMFHLSRVFELALIRLDTPDRFGDLLMTAWENELELVLAEQGRPA